MARPIKQIKEALEKTGGNVSRAAEALEMSGRGLRQRIADSDELREFVTEQREAVVDLAEDVLLQEARVNQMEMDIDSELSAIIARRQPTARDLRLLVAIAKMIANLERVGDEAARVARTTKNLIESGISTRLPIHDLAHEAELAIAQLRKALDSFARLDVARALEVLKHDDEIDQEFEGLMRKLITFMMEDPRTISSSIDLIFVAKAIERVGDHAKNLAEVTIYVVKGADVRHQGREDLDKAVE
ncbi:MAG: phosphate signaling complex protein PhoU [Burkholderiaceae bacterium]